MKRSIALSLVLFIFALAAPAMAGDEDQGQLAISYMLQPKDGHESQFEEALKKQVAWYAEQNDQWTWTCWQWITGENFGKYIFRSGGHHWADWDTRGDLSAKAWNHFVEHGKPHVATMTSSINTGFDKISQWPEDYGEVPYVSVINFHIKMGKSRDFFNLLERIHKTVVKAEWPEPFWWSTTVSGGKMGVYTLVLPYKNWADMDEPETPFWKMMEKTAGRGEADSIRQGFIDCVEKQTSALAMFRPELSYIADKP